MTEQKMHYRLYKAKKRWIVAAVVTMALFGMNMLDAHASDQGTGQSTLPQTVQPNIQSSSDNNQNNSSNTNGSTAAPVASETSASQSQANSPESNQANNEAPGASQSSESAVPAAPASPFISMFYSGGDDDNGFKQQPDGSFLQWKTITRTINVQNPNGGVDTTIQKAKLTRTGVDSHMMGPDGHDLIDWSNTWNTAVWDAFVTPQVTGYIPRTLNLGRVVVNETYSNQIINISYVPDPSQQDVTVTIKLVDDNNGGAEVGEIVKSGKISNRATQDAEGPILDFLNQQKWSKDGKTHNKYTINPGTTWVNGFTFANGNQTFTVHLIHLKDTVFEFKNPTRTINITHPDGRVETIVQRGMTNRKGTIDYATGKTTWTSEATDRWLDYPLTPIAGYTMQVTVDGQPSTITEIPLVTVNNDTKDQTIDVSYVGEPREIHVVYKDGNTVIKTDPLNGRVGETVATNISAPTNYRITNNPAASYTFKVDHNHDITVLLAHVTHETSDTKTITRTINVTDPSGRTTTTRQVVTLTRTGEVDQVTGNILWGAWSTGSWPEFTTPTITGYVPTIAVVGQQAVTSTTADTTVNISYLAADQSINIIYMDGSQVVQVVPLSGQTGETVPTNIVAPANYHILNDPASSYTFLPSGNHDIIVELGHDIEHGQETKTITRTINVYLPDGRVETIKQVATLHRSKTTDKVTGESTYGPWSEDPNAWQEYVPANIPGYMVDPADVPAVVVTADQQDVTVNIHYYAQPKPSVPDHNHINDNTNAVIVPNGGNGGSGSVGQSGADQLNGNSQTSAAGRGKDQRLPQTGAKKTSQVAVLGLLTAALAGMLALPLKKRY